MVNLARLEQTDQFIAQAIKKLNPDFDVSTSDPFYDLFIRFFRQTDLPAILELYEQYINAKSLLQTEVTTEAYDKLLFNLQFSRITSTKHRVKFQLVLNEPVSLTINTSDNYIIDDRVYHPRFNLQIETTDFLQQQSGIYILEYELVADLAGTQYAVGINNTVITPFDSLPQFSRAFTTSITQVAVNTETNLEALQRLQNEFGLENAINKRGINFILSKYFSSVALSAYIAGFSEPEQKRDLRNIEIPKTIARCFFSAKVNLTIPANSKFFYRTNPDNKYILKNNETVSIPLNSLEWKQNPANLKWYVDIEVEPEDLYVQEPFQELVESSSDYLSLAYPSQFLAARSQTTLLENGEIRIGAHTDVYVKTNTVRRTFSLYVPIDSNGILDIPKEYQPLLKIHQIQEVGENNILLDVPVYSIIVNNTTLRYSARDNIQLFVQPSKVGTNIIIDATIAEDINTIQEYFDNPLIRVIAENTLIRYYNPCFVAVIAILTGSPDLDNAIKTAISDYILNLSTGTWNLTDFVTAVTNQVPEFKQIALDSISVFIQQLFPDGTSILLEGEELITPQEDELLGVSIRNTSYILEAVEIKYV